MKSRKVLYNYVTLLLVGLYMLTVTKPAFHVIHYTINYGTYVNQLCVNKDKPQLNCNGTCALAKKISDLKEPQENPALPVFESLYWYVAPVSSETNEFTISLIERLSFIPYLNSLTTIEPEIPTPPPNIIVKDFS